jgi:hypothetical protein
VTLPGWDDMTTTDKREALEYAIRDYEDHGTLDAPMPPEYTAPALAALHTAAACEYALTVCPYPDIDLTEATELLADDHVPAA